MDKQPVSSSVNLPLRTMTSLEIASLTGKNHKEVLRDIRQMAKVLESANLRSHSQLDKYQSAQGKPLPMYRLDKETTLTLLTGYDIVARHKINQRWTQLETERIEEEANPELAVKRGNERATKAYKKLGHSESWIAQRIISITTRKAFTFTLSISGVQKEGFRNCTNAIYTPLYGGTSNVVRMKKGLSKNQSIRDNMSMVELSAIMLSESLAAEQIESGRLKGNAQCELACSRASKAVAHSIITARQKQI